MTKRTIAPVREASVVQRTRDHYREVGGKVLKTEGEGEPDLIGSVAGLTVVIECKTPGNEPSVLQRTRLREWARSGSAAGWTDDGEVLHIFDANGWKYDIGLRDFLYRVRMIGERAARIMSVPVDQDPEGAVQ